LQFSNFVFCQGHSLKCHVANTNQITDEVQMPLGVTPNAEDGEREVQNIYDDNGDVYLETATTESLFVRAKKKEPYVTDMRIVGSVCIKIALCENLLVVFLCDFFFFRIS